MSGDDFVLIVATTILKMIAKVKIQQRISIPSENHTASGSYCQIYSTLLPMLKKKPFKHLSLLIYHQTLVAAESL